MAIASTIALVLGKSYVYDIFRLHGPWAAPRGVHPSLSVSLVPSPRTCTCMPLARPSDVVGRSFHRGIQHGGDAPPGAHQCGAEHHLRAVHRSARELGVRGGSPGWGVTAAWQSLYAMNSGIIFLWPASCSPPHAHNITKLLGCSCIWEYARLICIRTSHGHMLKALVPGGGEL